jgi:hypothetical protein
VADIVLAEYQGQAWLVGGEEYIDDLLANTLESNITIEILGCDSQSAVRRMWQGGDACDPSGMPWMIHPAIVARLRRAIGGLRVAFTPWSAMLDDEARAVLGVAAARAADGMALVLGRRPDPGEAAAAGDLAGLRLHLIEAHLAALGVPPERISRDPAAAAADGVGDCVHIVLRAA